MFKSKSFWYILLFGILYLIVAFSSFFHAISFFGLANNTWMSIILAFAFEIGQAAVLFSLLTSKKDRSRIMPWVLMTMFTLVQVIGNVFSSYKYIITHSEGDLKYFKEPIFIWTDLPDAEATVIIVYIVGAILPIAALLLTSMITNYLSDTSELNKKEDDIKEVEEKIKEHKEIEQETPDNNTDIKEEVKNKEEIVEPIEEKIVEPVKEEIVEPIEEEIVKPTEKENKEIEKTIPSHFINI